MDRTIWSSNAPQPRDYPANGATYKMIRTELIIQLLKVVIGLAFGAYFVWWSLQVLEPVSKSPEEDNEAGELNKAQEVLVVVLPADEEPALPLDPGEKALNEPAAHMLRHDGDKGKILTLGHYIPDFASLIRATRFAWG